MKKAKIAVKEYVQTKSMKAADDLGLAEEDIATIRSKLAGIEEEEKLDGIRIEKAIPYSIIITDQDGKPPLVTMFILCSDKNGFFILYHNYIVENEEDLESVKDNPLYIENQFMSNNVLTSMLSKLKKYNTDLNLYTIDKNDKFANSNDMFYIFGYIKDEEENIVKIYLDAATTNLIMYSDNYINECDNSRQSIETLSYVMYMEGFFDDTKPERIFLDHIEDVSYLALKDKKESTYQVVFKIKNPNSKSETDKFINISKHVIIEDDKKLKPNIKESDLNELLITDKDKYSTIFYYDCLVDDKEYMVLKSFNIKEDKTAGDSILLCLDNDMVNSLYDLIYTKFTK